MDKVIMKRFNDSDTWEESSLQEAINKLSGYWNSSEIESMLLTEGLTLWNPFAYYKAVYKES
jgi:hypothetical protein